MRLVFAGTPGAAVPSLTALLDSGHEVAAVVTRPDAPAGRGLKVAPSPVAQRAGAAGLEVLKPARPRDPGFLGRLREIGPDCCAVTAYGALVPQAALDIPRHGWVNLHFSLLPAWRGAAPVQHAIMHGDDITGATTFRLVAELDAGPVFGVLTEPVLPSDTAGDLLARLAAAGAALLVATMDGIASGELIARPQPPDGISLAPKITPADARIDWGLRPRRSTGLSAPAHRSQGPGPCWLGSGSSSGRWPASQPPSLARRSNPVSCASFAPRQSWGQVRCPYSLVTSSRTASGGCRPRTGRGGCAGCHRPGPC